MHSVRLRVRHSGSTSFGGMWRTETIILTRTAIAAFLFDFGFTGLIVH